MTDPRLPFDTLAQPNTGAYPDEFVTFGSAWFLHLHGCDDPVPVTLVPDSEGKYLTWLDAKGSEPAMTYWAKHFDIQFPYGHKVEEEAGKGRAVRVRVDPRTPPPSPEREEKETQ